MILCQEASLLFQWTRRSQDLILALSFVFFLTAAGFFSSVQMTTRVATRMDASMNMQRQVNSTKSLPYNATHLPALAFLHVGKTAGTTLSFQINGACMSPQICLNNRPRVQNETLTARAMKRYFHVNHMNLFNPARFDGYIIPVRNPIDRIVSAYLMHHPKNHPLKNNTVQDRFYQECYPQVYSLASPQHFPL